MTDATEEDVEEQLDEEDELDEEGGGGSKGFGRKKIMLIALPVLLIVGIGAGAWLSGIADPLLGKEEELVEEAQEEGEASGQAVYFDLPQMLVNLNTPGRRSSFLKIVVSLELSKVEDEERLKEAMPRIIDNFQIYLRELRVEDLRGSAGLYRLREELLFRVNAAVHPARVTDVLFKEMLVQ